MVQTLEMGDQMLNVSQQLSNKNFYRRLNTISAANDAPANDVMYHDICWVKAKREADKGNKIVKESDYINESSDNTFC